MQLLCIGLIAHIAPGYASDCVDLWDRGFRPLFPIRVDLKADQWEKMRTENKWNNVELRDNRYNQVASIFNSSGPKRHLPYWACACALSVRAAL